MTTIRLMLAQNFASTIATSETGEVSNTSSVRSFLSSANSRIVINGTVSMNSTNIWKNTCTMLGW